MISLRGINKSYADADGGTHTVLSGADLSIEQGELVAIVGPSGCGKTTLLNIIGGLDNAFEGEAEVAGQKLKQMGDRELSVFRNKTVGFVFQSFNLIAPMTALENVMLPDYFGIHAESRPQRIARATAALARVGLEGKEGRLPRELSGGERQRVAIARAMFGQPRLILCDEPTGNLDAKTATEVINLFAGLAREEKQTVVVVTHEDRVSRAAKRVLRLREGRLVEELAGVGAAS